MRLIFQMTWQHFYVNMFLLLINSGTYGRGEMMTMLVLVFFINVKKIEEQTKESSGQSIVGDYVRTVIFVGKQREREKKGKSSHRIILFHK